MNVQKLDRDNLHVKSNKVSDNIYVLKNNLIICSSLCCRLSLLVTCEFMVFMLMKEVLDFHSTVDQPLLSLAEFSVLYSK